MKVFLIFMLKRDRAFRPDPLHSKSKTVERNPTVLPTVPFGYPLCLCLSRSSKSYFIELIYTNNSTLRVGLQNKCRRPSVKRSAIL